MICLEKPYEMVRITYSYQKGRMVASYFDDNGHCPRRASIECDPPDPFWIGDSERAAFEALAAECSDLLFTVVSEIKNDLGTFFIVEVEGRPNYLTE